MLLRARSLAPFTCPRRFTMWRRRFEFSLYMQMHPDQSRPEVAAMSFSSTNLRATAPTKASKLDSLQVAAFLICFGELRTKKQEPTEQLTAQSKRLEWILVLAPVFNHL